MSGWKPSGSAPRDRDVWLFLPSASFKRLANGTVTDVTHAIVVARWDKLHGAWINSIDDRCLQFVYPSLWHDAPVDGPEPEIPELP